MRDLIPRKELGTMTTRLFDDFWNELDNWMSPHRTVVKTKFSYPKLNIKNGEKEYLIEAAVPGLTKENVRVEYSNGLLTIAGSSQNEGKEENNGYVVREMHKSSFARSINIDEEDCDVENIEAGVENGVLTVKIPKKVLDTAVPKRIIEVK